MSELSLSVSLSVSTGNNIDTTHEEETAMSDLVIYGAPYSGAA